MKYELNLPLSYEEIPTTYKFFLYEYIFAMLIVM